MQDSVSATGPARVIQERVSPSAEMSATVQLARRPTILAADLHGGGPAVREAIYDFEQEGVTRLKENNKMSRATG
jgi:hypothetical protein